MNLKINVKLIRDHLLRRQERTLPIRAIKQPLDNLCWATCYRMVNSWMHSNWSLTWCADNRCSPGAGCTVPNNSCNAPRLTKDVLPDWQALGYRQTKHLNTALALNDVRQNIKENRPLMAFVQYRRQSIGHYFLIVGTGRTRYLADNTFVIADPLKSNLMEIEVSELSLGFCGDWQQTWSIAA